MYYLRNIILNNLHPLWVFELILCILCHRNLSIFVNVNSLY